MNQKLKFLRETLGLTEKEISSFLNISSYKYSSFEKIAVKIPCDILILVSRVYNIDIRIFLDNSYTNQDLLTELIKQGIVEKEKEYILESLKQNLFHNNDTKVTYRTVAKVRVGIQNNIINSIAAMIKNSGMNLCEFAAAVDIDKQSLESILLKKRFIDVEELVNVSEKFRVSINDIVSE